MDAINDQFKDILTPRQIDVCREIAKGLNSRAIAEELGVQYECVGYHLNNIYRRLKIAEPKRANLIYMMSRRLTNR